MAGRTLSEQEWAGLLARAPGPGVYAVKTTAVVCRTGCPARTPLRHNVVMFDDLETALMAGYRPCKRCKPGSGRPAQEVGNQAQAGCL